MVDHKDWATHAQLDIERAEDLFEKKDYGAAVFSAQQALEKYIKAFLLKQGIFDNPKKLGHLPHPAVLEKIIEYFTHFETLGSNLGIAQYIKSVKKYFENQVKLLKKIKSNQEYQIAFWKLSLGVKDFSDKEREIGRQMLSELDKNKEEVHNAEINANLSMQKIQSSQQYEMSDEDNQTYDKLVQDFISVDKFQKSKVFKEMLELVKPYWIKFGLATEEDLEVFTEFGKILGVFDLNALTLMLLSYSHEQISRYPEEVDGKTSTEYYVENKDKVKERISKIKETCERIKSEIDL